MDTRRDFLKKAIMLAGAAGSSGLFSDAIARALAIPPTPGTTYHDAEHVVILMQENRSFDHCYGALRGVRGFDDPRAVQQFNGNRVWLQSNSAGETYAPFRLDIKYTKATWMSALPHSRESQVDAWNHGRYDRWLDSKRPGNREYAHIPMTMGHYTREDLPFYYDLADAFTVCDQHFCSAMTSTTPNRLMFWSGSLREKQIENSKAYIRNPDMVLGRKPSATWETFPERMEDAGIAWRFYQNELMANGGLTQEEISWLGNMGLNPLEYVAQYNAHLASRHSSFNRDLTAKLASEISALTAKLASLPKQSDARHPIVQALREKHVLLKEVERDQTVLEEGGFSRLSKRQQQLHQKAFVTNQNDPHFLDLETIAYQDGDVEREFIVPKGDILYQFRKDVEDGKLPTVSYLAPPQQFSSHPSAPWYGAWYVSEVMNILTANPEVWRKTIFILTFDENDGYFDHVPPFVAPNPHRRETGFSSKGLDTGLDYVLKSQEIREGVRPEEAREAPVGMGYRVPMVIASPWTRGGWVNSQVFDHTSNIQFLEKFLSTKSGKNVREKNLTEWRRTVAGDLTSIFQPEAQKTIPELSFVKRKPFMAQIHQAQFRNPPTDYKNLNDVELAGVNKNPARSPHMPHQESGVRPSCALPYELYVDGALDENGKSFEITMSARNRIFGDRAAGSPFSVYAYGLTAESTPLRSYAVAAGDQLHDAWPLDAFSGGAYKLAVHGPNGFYREFGGSSSEPRLKLLCEYEAAPSGSSLTGNLKLILRNSGDRSLILELTDNAYGKKSIIKRVPPRGSAALKVDLQGDNHGWYDFTVRQKGNETFWKTFAGRVETGQAGFSDPQIGRQA